MYVQVAARTGVRTGVRQYSSEPGKESMFLTDLLSRIDKISSTTKKIADSQAAGRAESQTAGQANKPRARKPSGGSDKSRSEKVQVADHPLFSSKFASRERGPARQSAAAEDSARDPRGPRGPRTANTGGGARAARPSKGPGKPREPRRQKNIDVQPIPSKTLTYGPYEPQLTNSTFVHGKVASVNNCTSARVASVTKEALIDSKYPYMLPKEIVHSVAPDVTRNKFLLQSNFTLDVNQEKLKTRINEVVKGQVTDMPVDLSQFKDPKDLKLAVHTKQQLMKNGDLSLADKLKIFEVANGLKTPKQLVENSHWAK